MADMRDLWWAAGRMAFSVAENDDWRNQRWTDSLRRSATLIEPVWPKTYSNGTFTYALPTIALLLYAVPLGDDPEHVPVEDIVTALTPRRADPGAPSLEDTIREGLIKRRHDLDDDSPLSSLFRSLTTYQPPLAYTSTGLELTSADHGPGGTLMGAAVEWIHHTFTHHYLGRSSA
ncbi:hypothetical protein ABT063_10470 [Streptomyces sp. NPDC002838]|uniref:hypothetical protein n=1 Tax=Streptomyces sp. NPDC002838 TaxID=3154436 RepID=UPI00332CBC83